MKLREKFNNILAVYRQRLESAESVKDYRKAYEYQQKIEVVDYLYISCNVDGFLELEVK